MCCALFRWQQVVWLYEIVSTCIILEQWLVPVKPTSFGWSGWHSKKVIELLRTLKIWHLFFAMHGDMLGRRGVLSLDAMYQSLISERASTLGWSDKLTTLNTNHLEDISRYCGITFFFMMFHNETLPPMTLLIGSFFSTRTMCSFAPYARTFSARHKSTTITGQIVTRRIDNSFFREFRPLHRSPSVRRGPPKPPHTLFFSCRRFRGRCQR